MVNLLIVMWCVRLERRKKKTRVINNNHDPKWRIGSHKELLVFSVFEESSEIIVRVMDKNRFDCPEKIGQVSISVGKLVELEELDEWFCISKDDEKDSSLYLHMQYKLPKKIQLNTMWESIKEKNYEKVSLLLNDPNINVNETDSFGDTVLHYVMQMKEYEPLQNIIIKLISCERTDLNIKNLSGNTPLHLFCKRYSLDSDDVLQYLIQCGADVNSVNNVGETPLHQTIFNPSTKHTILKILIQHNADINSKNNQGETPLHYAVRLGRLDLAKLLVICGANIKVKSESNEDPHEIATSLGYKSIAQFLRNAGELMKFLSENGLQKYQALFLEQDIDLQTLTEVTRELVLNNIEDEEYADKLIDAVKNIKKDEYTTLLKSSFDDDECVVREVRRKVRLNTTLKESIIVWEIDPMDLDFELPLGNGSSGEVFKGKYLNNTVAIKSLLHKGNPEKEMEEFIKEFNILISIKSPYIVKFYGATLLNKLCMVMEYCEKKSLYEILQRDTSIEWDWSFSFRIIIEIVRGIHTLHTNNPTVIHRDLKTLNVLVNGDNHCKLADFGLSRFDTSTNLDSLKKCKGTYAYIAPEGLFLS